ncbi:DUF4136 domain-containing protein [Pontibacter vulgaris]|uniref:DUF4136 domain-containing protein n=1 Tax=Pontibacter vulgaris TaxID=2905679 RepID=UPI001FA6E68B|nr:DUF4136 domain-containing protein [Pontibacter vulgaris]
MTPRYFNACYFLLILTLFSACVATSGISHTNTILAPKTNLTKYKTFAWYQDKPAAEPVFDKGYNAALDKNIRLAIEQELLKKGYQKATGKADMLLAYDVSVSVPVEKDKPENFAPGFGYSYGYMAGYRYKYGDAGLPGYRAVDLFKQGTLILDVVDTKSKQLLWRGWTEGAIENFKASAGTVHKEVETILNKFPAATK